MAKFDFKNYHSFTILGFLYLCTLAVSLSLSPFFLTYDSYHYLNLSIHPVFGDSHSLFYGFFLKFLMAVSKVMGLKSFESVYIVWNSFCYFFFFIFLPLRSFTFEKKSNESRVLILLFTSAIYLVVLISNLILENALWSEMTCLLLIGLMSLFHARWVNNGSKIYLLFVAIIFPISYHTRYLTIVIPVALAVIAIIDYLRGSRTKAFRSILSIISMLAILIACNFVLKRSYTNSLNKKLLSSLAVSFSMQCTLRCETKMFETDCSTPEGKSIIENSFCTQIVFGLVKMGNLIEDPNKSGLAGVFKQNGFLNTIKWFMMAPLTYLNDKHELEISLFNFGSDTGAISHYPDVVKEYGQYFEKHNLSEPSKPFKFLMETLGPLFHNYFFHFLTILTLILNCYVILRSKNTEVLFLALYGLGTYFLFAYANPHVPYRFLLQIISPSVIAFMIHVSHRPNHKQFGAIDGEA